LSRGAGPRPDGETRRGIGHGRWLSPWLSSTRDMEATKAARGPQLSASRERSQWIPFRPAPPLLVQATLEVTLRNESDVYAEFALSALDNDPAHSIPVRRSRLATPRSPARPRSRGRQRMCPHDRPFVLVESHALRIAPLPRVRTRVDPTTLRHPRRHPLPSSRAAPWLSTWTARQRVRPPLRTPSTRPTCSSSCQPSGCWRPARPRLSRSSSRRPPRPPSTLSLCAGRMTCSTATTQSVPLPHSPFPSLTPDQPWGRWRGVRGGWRGSMHTTTLAAGLFHGTVTAAVQRQGQRSDVHRRARRRRHTTGRQKGEAIWRRGGEGG